MQHPYLEQDPDAFLVGAPPLVAACAEQHASYCETHIVSGREDCVDHGEEEGRDEGGPDDVREARCDEPGDERQEF